MSIHKAAREELLNNAAIFAKVNTRIYQLRLPDDVTLPAISFFRVSNSSDPLINKFSPRFQFDVWSKSISEAREIAELIRKTFNRFKGELGGVTTIKQGVYDNMYELYEKDTGIYHVSVDVFFHYLEK